MRATTMMIWLVAVAAAAPAAEIPTADFARDPIFRNMKISPDGEYVAANAIVENRAQLVLIRLADRKGVRVNAYEDTEVSDFWWVGPHRVMYTATLRTGALVEPQPIGELFVTDADGEHNKSIYGAESHAGEFLSRLPDDPNHALIRSLPYERKEPYTQVLEIDLRTGSNHVVAKAPIRLADFLADHAGHVRVAWGEDTERQDFVYYRKDDAAEWAVAFQSNKDDPMYEPIVFDRDDRHVFLACSGARKAGGLCRWDTQTGEVETLWSGNSEVTHLLRTSDGRGVYGLTAMPDRPTAKVLDLADTDGKALLDLYRHFAGQRVTITSASLDGRKSIVYVDSDTNPGDFYLFDRASGSLSKLLSRMPWIQSAQMASMEPIELEARDGLKLHGYLTRPLGKETAKQLPMVLLVHGGPYGVRDRWGFNPEVQLLASRGYAVLQVNFRGSTGYGHAFARAGFHEWGGKMQDDITDATRWAVAQGIADAKRICIYGASYGGYAALEGAVKEPELYQCAIGDSGIYDLRLMHSRGDIHETELGEAYLMDALGNDGKDLADRSPISHVDRLRAHVMLIVGGADRRAPPVHAKDLHRALDERKIPHEWIYHVNEGHGYVDVAHRTEMYDKIIAFLDRSIGVGSATIAATEPAK